MELHEPIVELENILAHHFLQILFFFDEKFPRLEHHCHPLNRLFIGDFNSFHENILFFKQIISISQFLIGFALFFIDTIIF